MDGRVEYGKPAKGNSNGNRKATYPRPKENRQRKPEAIELKPELVDRVRRLNSERDFPADARRAASSCGREQRLKGTGL